MSFLSLRSRAVLGCVIAAAALLAGCSEDVPQRAGTLDQAATNGVESSDEDVQDRKQREEDFSRAGRQLTKAEAKAALPRVSSLPTGWSVDPENTLTREDESDDDDIIRPARCEVVLEGLSDLEKKPAAKAGVTFTAGMLGPFLGVNVSSYPEEVPGEQFDRMLAAFNKCPRFSVDDGESKTRFTASALSFPNFGEESAAVRMTAKSEGMSFALDVVTIRAGHNLVSVMQMSVGGAGPVKPLRKAAQVTMANLDG